MTFILHRATLLAVFCASCMVLGCVSERDKLRSELLRFEESVDRLEQDGRDLLTIAEARKIIGASPDMECDMQTFQQVLAKKGYGEESESVSEMLMERHATTVRRVSVANEAEAADEAAWTVWLYFWERPFEFKSVHYRGLLRRPKYRLCGYLSHYVLIWGDKVVGAGSFVLPLSHGSCSPHRSRGSRASGRPGRLPADMSGEA